MAWEKANQRFENAVRCLVDEPGRIKERLLVAYVSQLSGLDPDEDLPGELVSPFGAIRAQLREDQVPGDRGNPALQLDKMTERDASRMAGDILSMFLELDGITRSK
jgi:hypothetical protein